ncbi:MAG: electron transport complex subunit RsxE [bacterium]
MSSSNGVLRNAVLTNNPAWAQLLGLCPLMAVSTTVINALGLAAASSFVVIGSNVMISALRHHIPEQARLPCFVLIIATFTTVTTLVLEAFSYELYLKIALFVQIIVTNCMILGRAEAFASRQPVGAACLDALGTAVGFAIALITLGSIRELLTYGSLLRDGHLLFGDAAGQWTLQLFQAGPLPLAAYAPGAFIVAGVLFALAKAFTRSSPDVDAAESRGIKT